MFPRGEHHKIVGKLVGRAMHPGKISYGNEPSSAMKKAVSLVSPNGGSFPFGQIRPIEEP